MSKDNLPLINDEGIRKIQHEGEWYYSITDVIKALNEVVAINNKEPKEELSDFNKKLKKGLEWNPKKNK